MRTMKLFAVVIAVMVLASIGHAQAAPPLARLSMSQSQYHQGDVVQFTLTNVSNQVLALPDPAPWYIQRGGKTVYQVRPLAIVVYLAPGESIPWSIEAEPSGFGDISQPGHYTLDLMVYVAPNVPRWFTADFVRTGN